MEAPELITCMECGGNAGLASQPPPDQGFTAGDVAVYLCEDCGQRIDLVLEEDDYEP